MILLSMISDIPYYLGMIKSMFILIKSNQYCYTVYLKVIMVELEASDIIRLIEQFLKENSLIRTLSVLQEESMVYLNIVENIEQLKRDIVQGNWDIVLTIISNMKLPEDVLLIVYEQIYIELIQMNEKSIAKMLLHKFPQFAYMREHHPERYLSLEHLSESSIQQDTLQKRHEIASLVSKHVHTAPSSLLLELIGQALKWQQQNGMLPLKSSQPISLFTNPLSIIPKPITNENTSHHYLTIRMESEECHPECAMFSPDGKYLATGASDGMIEFWDIVSGQLADLPWQPDGSTCLTMTHSVLCIAFQSSTFLFASGSSGPGNISIWNLDPLHDASLIFWMENLHTKGITTICFSNNHSWILTGGFDKIIKLVGLESRTILKEFRGHDSFINQVSFQDDKNIISASSDGTVKIWNIDTGSCLETLSCHVDAFLNIKGHPIYSVSILGDNLLICNAYNAHCISKNGKILYEYKHESPLLKGVLSIDKKYYYILSLDGWIHVLDCASFTRLSSIQVLPSNIEPVGIIAHPSENIISIYSIDGSIRFYRNVK